MKYDEKALQCYKTAGDKIKEYESNSKKCEEMLNKCGNKLNACNQNKTTVSPSTATMACNTVKNPCNTVKNPCDEVVEKTCSCKDEIVYIDMNNSCGCGSASSYVTPMYNLSPMQNMGHMQSKYPSLDNGCGCMMNQYQDMNDMWMNYYMYMQQMMNQMPYNK